jgi:hypothetical protein
MGTTKKRTSHATGKAPGRPTLLKNGGTVFLSYSRVDREYVSSLAKWLRGHGVRVWFDHEIDYGTRWEAEIETRLASASVLLVVMSKAARRSRWVRREINRAKERGIPVLPLLLKADGIVDQAGDLQFDNVSGGRMPTLRFCQKLPGFLVREEDLASSLTGEQREIAGRIASAVGRNLGPGTTGPGVAALQIELLRVGLDPGPINGVFGRETQRAFLEFQRRRCHAPRVDGRVGPIYWAILVSSSLGDLAPSAPASDGRS